MATIKSYTDINQSKKLAEILPLESADMHYCLEQRDIASGYEIGITPYTKAKSFIGKCNIVDVQPAWSLASLLEILKSHCERLNIHLRADKNYNIFAVSGDFVFRSFDDFPDGFDTPVDACCGLILKLNELKML